MNGLNGHSHPRVDSGPLRIALFTDSYLETNGVGTLCREYAGFAREQGIPFFCAYGGKETKFSSSGSMQELQVRRGPLSFPIDAGLWCDPLLNRHITLATERLREFRPHLVHITGPGDLSILGLWAANRVGVPVMASWHTNLHDYACRRLGSSLAFLPERLRNRICGSAWGGSLWALSSFYRVAHFVAAPNGELVDLLRQRTGRPTFLMAHGVNTEMFAPGRRSPAGSRFTIGYVGRLTPEKNVRALMDLERQLMEAGERDFRILLVGDGSEREWLRSHLRTAEFTGFLRGEELAGAFASMDAFVFPSLTDTFGLVILEAMSSGVPVVLTPETGRRAGVTDGIEGFLTDDLTAGVRKLMHCEETRRRMREAGRKHACSRAWAGVVEDLHRVYHDGLRHEGTLRRMPTPTFEPLPRPR